MSSQWFNTLGRSLKANSPSILSGIAVAGVVATVVLAVKATPRACEELAAAEENKGYELEQVGTQENGKPMLMNKPAELTIQEKVQTTWRLYLPAGLSGVATIACIIGANVQGARRNAALAGAYTLVDQSFRQYKDKVLEEISPQKAGKIEDELNKERLQQAGPPRDNQVVVIGSGEVLTYDTLTGRYFKSNIEDIRRAVNEINTQILTDMYASQNDFYERIGLGGTTLGEELGWNFDNQLEVHYSSLLNECDQPCLVLGYKRLPVRDYHKF